MWLRERERWIERVTAYSEGRSPVVQMPKRFRSKRRNAISAHKARINKTKNYRYHNPADVEAKVSAE